MQKFLKRWIKVINQKILGYLLFYIEDVGKRKEAFQMLDKRAKEKPVSFAGQHRRRLTTLGNRREAV